MQLENNIFQRFGTTIFSEMSELANRHQAINLSQGFPEFEGPEPIKQAAIAAINSAQNQYAPSAGILALRELLAQRKKKVAGLKYDPATEVTIYSGATEALFTAFTAFLEPGDEVVALAPVFDCYEPAIVARGGKLLVSPLLPPTYGIDLVHLESLISPQTKILLLNTPHNPTGRVFTDAEMSGLAAIAERHDLLVITDEVYEELIFAGHKHLCLAAYPGLRQRTIVISSTAKTFSLTGWKIGYAFAPEKLSKIMRIVHQYTVFCSATPLQYGMIAALEMADDYYVDFRRDYQKRCEAMVAGLREAGLSCQSPEGTYFALASYAELSELGAYDFAKELVSKAGVAAIPLSSFAGGDKAIKDLRVLRFGFCKNLSTIEAGCARLKAYFQKAS